MARTSGTKEWADSNVNVVEGCAHDCLYCYAKRMAIRFKRKTTENWKVMVAKPVKRFKKRHGRVMFPTSHDIIPGEPGYDECIETIIRLVIAGNEVLVTTKPHVKAVRDICSNILPDYKDKVQFRFTITSNDTPRVTDWWEPGAPPANERIAALQLAYILGWKTSVSIEPCLDADPRPLVARVRPFVTESIWLGTMNYCEGPYDKWTWVPRWFEWFKDDPLVRFKDSARHVIEVTFG